MSLERALTPKLNVVGHCSPINVLRFRIMGAERYGKKKRISTRYEVLRLGIVESVTDRIKNSVIRERCGNRRSLWREQAKVF